MKGNPLLKYLVIPFLLIVVFIGIKTLGGGPKTQDDSAPAPKLTAEQAKALGVEGDTRATPCARWWLKDANSNSKSVMSSCKTLRTSETMRR